MRGKATVLLLDTDPSLKRMVSELTRRLHCDFASFKSAEELLSSDVFGQWAKILQRQAQPIADEQGIVCLVSELRLPGMDGPQLMRWLRDRHLMIPIIFVTSCGDLSSAAEVVKRGAVDVLTKPVVHDRLQGALESGIRFSPWLRRFEEACRRQAERLARLSDREREVLDRVLRRMPLKQIAVDLGTSPHTVRNQRQSILQKLDASDDADLLMIVLSVRMRECGLNWPLLPMLSGAAMPSGDD